MKIAFDCRLLQVPRLADGASRYAAELLSSLVRAPGGNQYYFFGYGGEPGPAVLDGILPQGGTFVPAYRRPGSTALNQLLFEAQYPRLLKRHGIDIYHAFFQTNGLSRCPARQIITVHDLGPFLSHPGAVRKKIERAAGLHLRLNLANYYRYRCHQKADLILSDSEFTRQALLRHRLARPEKIRIFHPGLAARPRPSPEAAGQALAELGIGGKYLLMVGRIQPLKNILGAIRAVQIAREQGYFNGQLVVAGAARDRRELSYLEKCQVLARELGIASSVRFLGFVEEAGLAPLYLGAAALLQPSFLEGFGFPPLEAAALGVPLVVSEIGSLPEICGTAVRVSPFDPAAIAGGIRKALNDRRGEPAEWRSWEQAAAEFLELCRWIMPPSRQGGSLSAQPACCSRHEDARSNRKSET